MKKIVLFIALALVLVPLNSCKKDDEPAKTELLTDSVWIGVTQKEYVNETLEDTYDISYLQLNFKTDNTLVITDTEDNDVETTAWSFNSNKTQIITNGVTLTIDTLSETSLIILDEDTYDNDVYKYVSTFKH